MIRVFTANIGGRDAPHGQAPQDVDVEWLYYTDDLDAIAPEPWIVVQCRPPHGEHPNMSAKRVKTHPPLVWPDPSSPLSTHVGAAIWIDASMEVTSHRFAREAVDALKGAPLATWKHPRRQSIYAEVEASLGRESQNGRYDALPLREQAAAYRAEGYLDTWGLYACGTIVWTDAARPLGAAWFAECEKWGYQDQISFPVVCWRAGIVPATFPMPQIERHGRGFLQNRWMRLWSHNPGTD